MRRLCAVTVLLAVLLAVGLGPALGAAQALPACPPSVVLRSEWQAVPEGWQPRSEWVTHRLERISFQLASDAGDLRPDAERIERGQRVLSWDVTGLQGLQQVCVYARTEAVLKRPVAPGVSRCEARQPVRLGQPGRVEAWCR